MNWKIDKWKTQIKSIGKVLCTSLESYMLDSQQRIWDQILCTSSATKSQGRFSTIETIHSLLKLENGSHNLSRCKVPNKSTHPQPSNLGTNKTLEPYHNQLSHRIEKDRVYLISTIDPSVPVGSVEAIHKLIDESATNFA